MEDFKVGIVGLNENYTSELKKRFHLTFWDKEEELIENYNNYKVVVTYGIKSLDFPKLCNLPPYLQQRWLFVEIGQTVEVKDILEVWFHYLHYHQKAEEPIISIVVDEASTADYYNHLLKQSYSNWQLIYHKNEKTDPRVVAKSNGYPGHLQLLFEGNQKLAPNALKRLANAYIQYPEGLIFYFDRCAYQVNSNMDYDYQILIEQQLVYVKRPVEIHLSSITDWDEINPGPLAISSKFLYTLSEGTSKQQIFMEALIQQKLILVATPGLVEEVIKASSIEERDEWYFLRDYFKKELEQCLQSPPSGGKNWSRIWEHYSTVQMPDRRFIYHDPELISILTPTFKRTEPLKEAIKSILTQEDQNFEICVVGDKCPVLDANIMDLLKLGGSRIKIFNLTTNFHDGGSRPRNHALKRMVSGDLIAHLDDDNTWENNHLSSMRKALSKVKSATFVFSSFWMGEYLIICRQPRLYRIDTSSIMCRYSLFTRYGFWPTEMQVDWNLVNRWVTGYERWAATEIPTLNYVPDPARCNAKAIYEAYGDQK